jgi:glycerol-3-phosphate dehydrogenase (NAD(P)+)
MADAIERIAVLGGGAWGTALAETACRAGRTVTLWARDPALVAEINGQRTNARYLPGVTLDPRLIATIDAALKDVHAVLMVTPAQTTRAISAAMARSIGRDVPLVVCAKGIETATGKRLSDVLAETLPGAPVAILSGPSFAADVVRGLPAAITLASRDPAMGQAVQAALAWRAFRPYWTDDVIGVEIGGAIKNVLAIAAGILDGKALGASAHAALVTRGFAELRRFAAHAGARPETLMGLSGLGDLLLTCGSPQSRNMSFGRRLGQGQTLGEATAGGRGVVEGVPTARAVVNAARVAGIEMPISAMVDSRIGVDAAIEHLMSRPLKAED